MFRTPLLSRMLLGAALVGLLAGCADDGESPLAAINNLPPRIRSITPLQVASGDTLVIEGDYFGETQGQNFVFIGGRFASQDTLLPDGRLLAVVPENLEPGDYEVNVRKVSKDAENRVVITIRAGISRILPDTAYEGREVVVAGTFRNGAQNVAVTLESLEAPTLGQVVAPVVVAAARSQLVLIAPAPLANAAGRYQVVYRDLEDNTEIRSRGSLRLEPQSSNLPYVVSAAPTPSTAAPGGLVTVAVQGGSLVASDYNVGLARVIGTATAVVTVDAPVQGVSNGGGGIALVQFRVPDGLIADQYRIRVTTADKSMFVFGNTLTVTN